ncbi:DUF6183 family protein (plasmid) [Deinococcus taeanensis]|uniref:DUF6183 family protein n=1 Tax=Deinococcus taeanensis TaxID=2737050 RepID=UPI001CDC080E|nr:DUF6183 family protein [Deinococcus taeanensis]UBV44753.1 DUF6183 family protein [Deinococcus taeanensis]
MRTARPTSAQSAFSHRCSTAKISWCSPGFSRRWWQPVTLPLALTDLELNLPLPQYGYVLGKFGGESRPGVTTPVVTPDMALPSRDEAWPAFQRADDEVVVEALGAPFHLWQQESNASLETRAFRFDAPLSRLDASLVGRLPVASVASPATTRVATSSGREVFIDLSAAGLVPRRPAHCLVAQRYSTAAPGRFC